MVLPSNTCRLCAELVNYSIPIFEEAGRKNNLPHKLRICSPVTVRETDTLPTKVCLDCLSNLDQVYEFYQKSKNAQLTLAAMIKLETSGKRGFPDSNDAPEAKRKRVGTTFFTFSNVENVAKEDSQISEGSKSSDDSKSTEGRKSTDGSQSTDGSKSTDGAKSTDVSKSTDGCKSTDGSKSTDSSKSFDGSASSGGSKSSNCSKSSDGSKISNSCKISDAGKSSDADKTSDDGKSSDPGKISDCGKSSDGGKISDAGKSSNPSKISDTGKSSDAGKSAIAGKSFDASSDKQGSSCTNSKQPLKREPPSPLIAQDSDSQTNIKKSKTIPVADKLLTQETTSVKVQRSSTESPLKECRYCKQEFHEDKLHQHEILHSGRAVYECFACEKAFTHKEAFDRHCARHNRQESLPTNGNSATSANGTST